MAGTIVKIKQSSVAGRVPTAASLNQGELALNTNDKKLYSKDGGGAVFEIGPSGVATANEIVTTEFVATSSQTTFSVSYDPANDHVNIYSNGVWLPPTDFTSTSGTTIVLDTGASAGTAIVAQVIKALNLAAGSDIDEHEFVATAGQTSFTISGGYNGVTSDIEVYVNGVKLRTSDFTSSSGTVVVLGTAAVVNDEVTVRVIKVAVLAAGSVNQTSNTGSAVLPAGTTAQRDLTPAGGYLRWNTTLNISEVYNDNTSAWQDVGQQTLTTEQVQDAVGPMLAGNTESGITVTYDDANNQIDFTVASQTDENFTTADHAKLDGIETAATADQSASQIKTAYESNADTNEFSDAEQTKLSNIEANATVDQTDADIRAAVEAATDSNVFTDADHSKLNAIEASATADQTDGEIRTAVEAATDSNVFTDADHTKLNAIEALADVTDTANVTSAGALMDSELAGLAAVKATTGTFLTADQTKLDTIETNADVTDTANVVSSLSAGTGVSISAGGVVAVTAVALTTVQAAASQVAHLALTAQEGDVVVRSDENKSYIHNSGSAGTMADYTLLATPTDAVLSVNGQTGAITAAQIATAVEAASNSNTFTDADHTKLNAIAASANNYVHPNHSGDVTSTGDGATVIGANKVLTSMILDDNVTAAKLANSINTDIATGVTGNTTANAALPKAGGAMTGAITTNSTFDGRDVAADGATADAALPKAGGTMTGALIVSAAVTANNLNVSGVSNLGSLDIYDSGTDTVVAADAGHDLQLRARTSGVVDVYANGTLNTKFSSTGMNVTGNIVVSGTVDGVDIAARDAILTSTTTTAGDALPKAGGTMTGPLTISSTYPRINLTDTDNNPDWAIINSNGAVHFYDATNAVNRLKVNTSGIAVTGNMVVSGTVDGVDISARDAILTSTTTAAGAALPKAGGAMTGTTTHGDSVISSWGAGADLQVWHDGGHARLRNATGNFNIQANDFHLTDGANAALSFKVDHDGATSIRYNQLEKLATTNTGINVTGNLQIGGTNVINSGLAMYNLESFKLADAKKAYFGSSNDLEIYHDGNNSYIKDVGTGTLNLQGATQVLIGSATTGEVGLQFVENAGVSLRHNNVYKMGTTNTGIDVTGEVAADSFLVQTGGDIEFDFNGLNNHFTTGTSPHIFAGQGSSGSYLAGSLNFQSRPTGVSRDITFITGTTPTVRLTVKDAGIDVTGNVALNLNSSQLQFGASNTMQMYHNGSVGEINCATGDFTIDVAGDITLDADGGQTRLKDNGVEWLRFSNESAVAQIYSPVVNSDIHLVGIRAAGTVEALKLDMSDGGAARFSSKIQTGNMTLEHTQITQSVGNLKLLTTAAAGHILLAPAGNVGINTSTPTEKLSVSGNISVTGTVDSVDIASRDAILTSTTTTAGNALPKAGGAMTGAITTNSTFDGVDIAVRDAVLTSTTATANAALPKAGGIITGAVEIQDGTNEWGHLEPNERHVSRLTRAEAGNVGTTGTTFTDVYGEADLTGIMSFTTFGYTAAITALEAVGARLPTLAEIMDGCGSGSGQSYDAEYLWTSTHAGHNKVWVCYGAYANGGASALRKIVDITDAAEVYSVRGFFDVAKANRPVTHTSTGDINIGSSDIALTGTVDGVDIAARDAILTSTTTTAGAALPKAGGTLTGNTNITKESPYLNLTDSSSSRTLGIFVDDNNSVLRASGPLLLQVGSTSAITINASRNTTLSGTLSVPDGTASAPSITNTGDSNTGIYFPTENSIALAAGAGTVVTATNTALNITSNTTNITSGSAINLNSNYTNLISTTSTSLNIQGGDGNSKNIIFKKTTGGTQQAKISTVGDDLRFTTGTTTERMRIDASGIDVTGTMVADAISATGSSTIGGNVNSVALKVHATNTAGAGSTTATINMKGYEGRGIGTFYEDVTHTGKEWYAGLPYSGGFAAYQIGYSATGSQAEYVANSLFTVKNDGKVGIGYNAPAVNLDVRNGTNNANVTVDIGPGTSAVDKESYLNLYRRNSSSVRSQVGVFRTGIPIAGIRGAEVWSYQTLGLVTANSTAGHIVFKPKGVEKMRIDAAGNVSIGSTSNLEKLYVNGNIRADGSYKVGGTVVIDSSRNITAVNTTLTGYLRGPASFVIDPAAHGDDTGTVVIAGNLQIDGTTTTVNSTTMSVNDLNLTLADGAANAAAANGAGLTIAGAAATLTYANVGDKFVFNKDVSSTNVLTPKISSADGTNIIFVNNSSNVGIGVTAPGKKLQVNGDIKLKNSGRLYLWADHDSNYLDYSTWRSSVSAGMSIVQAAASHLTLGTSNIERVRISSGGNVGIGTASPNQTLDVFDSTNYQGILVRGSNAPNITFAKNSGTTAEWKTGISGNDGAAFSISSGAANTDKLLINSSGNVGINTTSPYTKLHVNGTARFGNTMVGDASATNTPLTPLHVKSSGTGAKVRIEDSDSSNLAFDFLVNHGSGFSIIETIGGESGDNTRLHIADTTGNVGIGTASPGQMLDVSGNVNVTGDIILPDAALATGGTTLATVTQTAITSFALATYGAAKFIVTAKDGVNRQITELLVTHNGTTAIATEYGTIVTSGTLATYDVDVNVGSVRLLATSASASSTVYKIVETLIEA